MIEADIIAPRNSPHTKSLAVMRSAFKKYTYYTPRHPWNYKYNGSHTHTHNYTLLFDTHIPCHTHKHTHTPSRTSRELWGSWLRLKTANSDILLFPSSSGEWECNWITTGSSETASHFKTQTTDLSKKLRKKPPMTCNLDKWERENKRSGGCQENKRLRYRPYIYTHTRPRSSSPTWRF